MLLLNRIDRAGRDVSHIRHYVPGRYRSCLRPLLVLQPVGLVSCVYPGRWILALTHNHKGRRVFPRSNSTAALEGGAAKRCRRCEVAARLDLSLLVLLDRISVESIRSTAVCKLRTALSRGESEVVPAAREESTRFARRTAAAG